MRERTRLLTVALVALLVGSLVGAGFTGVFGGGFADADLERGGDRIDGVSDPELTTFASEDAFVEYFDDQSRVVPTRGDMTLEVEDDAEVASDGATVDADATWSSTDGDRTPRHSETNVQEAALDEPDVLKTDGESVYYAAHRYASRWDETSIVDVSDPDDPEAVGSIPLSGDLLLAGDTLVVLGQEEAAGYDVSDPGDPEGEWRKDLEARIDTARLYDGDLYLVLVDRPGGDPCPIEPYGDRAIECTDVIRPTVDTDADAVYTAARVDVGGSGTRAMYVDDYLYVFGEDEAVVLDETTWKVETRLEL
ncbi:beta-propeller domain-containing protein [Natronorubrum halophilum]|uniref:beta-propeller domain-containing protein n=1 Tax=Natronorubrum halophilum TaxID=1702106 RepID=UPI000EF6CF56|nr:beta-propeller domain-containing protein [Natronorubrum halophilum]